MWVAIIVVLVALGSLVFHLMTPWWSTEIASNWGSMDLTIDITFWVTGPAFIIIVLFVAYCIYKFRAQSGAAEAAPNSNHKASYEPENKKLEVWLTVGTAIGVAILLAPGLVVWNNYVTVPDDAVEIEVMGQQWQWGYRYPGADGKLGTTDARLVSGDNPFGLHLDDPNGQDDILVEGDDLHLQLGQPVNVLLRSLDVLHDFYVPEFRAKMDMVPGLVTFFWMTPIRTGRFDILCAELCGTGHYAMRGNVVVDEKADYDAWLAEQQTFAQFRASLQDKSKNVKSVAMNDVIEDKTDGGSPVSPVAMNAAMNTVGPMPAHGAATR
ncbi:MAG: cytochrome c oxidase subunit II [Alphaproteobacteria bacterium]|nr:cytochrome c oxidase subunit II [Alphaproteobacteria bacterium]